jgi:hypothetical protein
MSIKKWFKGLFKRETEEQRVEREVREEILEKAKGVEPPSMPEMMKRAMRKREAERGRDGLINAFYGTLVDRKPGEHGYPKKKHLHDGWRDGKSHPFRLRGATYDVQRNIDDSLELFNALMARFDEIEKE